MSMNKVDKDERHRQELALIKGYYEEATSRRPAIEMSMHELLEAERRLAEGAMLVTKIRQRAIRKWHIGWAASALCMLALCTIPCWLALDVIPQANAWSPDCPDSFPWLICAQSLLLVLLCGYIVKGEWRLGEWDMCRLEPVLENAPYPVRVNARLEEIRQAYEAKEGATA